VIVLPVPVRPALVHMETNSGYETEIACALAAACLSVAVANLHQALVLSLMEGGGLYRQRPAVLLTEDLGLDPIF